MTATTLAVLAAGWATVMALAPLLQARRMVRRRSAGDVSLGYLLVLLPGFALWVAYGAATADRALVAPNTLAFAVDAATVAVAIALRRAAARSRRPGTIDDVTVIKVNAISVRPDSGDELAHRFAARAGAVDDQDGFEGFELLKPTDERTTWLVLTRWRDEAAFQAWVNSPAFAHGHRSAEERSGEQAPPPVGTHSELWSFEVAGGSGGDRAHRKH